MEKCMFYQEKFLSGAGAVALQSLSTLATILLISHVDKVGDNHTSLLKCLAICIMSNTSSVRRQAIKEVNKVSNTLGGAAIICSLVEEMVTLLQTKLVVLDSQARAEAPPGGDIVASGDLPVGAVVAALTGLVVGGKWEGKEAEDLVMAILPACHHPEVMLADPYLWTRLVSKVKLDCKELMLKKKTDIVSMVEMLMIKEPSMGRGIVKTVINICPDILIPFIINNIETDLTNPKLLSVPAEEYQIFLTPVGEVYDKAAIDNLKSDSKAQNVKRENKAYSYKEQMEEIALR